MVKNDAFNDIVGNGSLKWIELDSIEQFKQHTTCGHKTLVKLQLS